jgi:hypothetical protein
MAPTAAGHKSPAVAAAAPHGHAAANNMERCAVDFVKMTEAAIAAWHGIRLPNDAAARMAADLENTIRAFEAVRDRMRFGDEPSSFEAALKETKE